MMDAPSGVPGERILAASPASVFWLCVPTINAALAAPNPTLNSVITTLLTEQAALGVVQPPPGGNSPGPGQPQYAGAVAKDGRATTMHDFKQLEAQFKGFNLQTDTGRRDAIAATLVPGKVLLAIRVDYECSSP